MHMFSVQAGVSNVGVVGMARLLAEGWKLIHSTHRLNEVERKWVYFANAIYCRVFGWPPKWLTPRLRRHKGMTL